MLAWVLVAGLATLGAASSELAPTPLSRLLKAIAANSGDGISRVACSDVELARALRREGVRVDASAALAWASSEEEVRDLVRAGKLVMCPNPLWAEAGAAVVVQVEGGRPVYYLYQDRAKQSGVYLRAVVYHYAKERR
jgi:hypothetical protein